MWSVCGWYVVGMWYRPPNHRPLTKVVGRCKDIRLCQISGRTSVITTLMTLNSMTAEKYIRDSSDVMCHVLC